MQAVPAPTADEQAARQKRGCAADEWKPVSLLEEIFHCQCWRALFTALSCLCTIVFCGQHRDDCLLLSLSLAFSVAGTSGMAITHLLSRRDAAATSVNPVTKRKNVARRCRCAKSAFRLSFSWIWNGLLAKLRLIKRGSVSAFDRGGVD